MSSRYSIPALDRYRIETVIKKSRFIVTLAHTPDQLTAQEFVADVRREFSDATHNCWAWQPGASGETVQARMSDDGEPQGTAGRPILNVLLHSGVGEIGAVVTRYFGGVKLGAGGLVRAYSGVVALGLETMPVREKIIPVRLEIVLDYAFVTQFKRLLPMYEAVSVREEYGTDACFELDLPREQAEPLEHAVRELTSGTYLLRA